VTVDELEISLAFSENCKHDVVYISKSVGPVTGQSSATTILAGQEWIERLCNPQ
jgi:hypothetical protein